MSTDSVEDGDASAAIESDPVASDPVASDPVDSDGTSADTDGTDPPVVYNAVSVHFATGECEEYAVVIRVRHADWLYAEQFRATGDDGIAEAAVEALDANQVSRIDGDRLHLFAEGVIHYGDDLVADPTALLEDSWFDADSMVL